MSNDLSLDDVEDQLGHYGRWLEERSEVSLRSPAAIDGPDPGGGPGRRMPILAALAAVTVLVFGAAIGVAANRDGGSTDADAAVEGSATGTDRSPEHQDGSAQIEEARPLPTPEVGSTDDGAPSSDPGPVDGEVADGNPPTDPIPDQATTSTTVAEEPTTTWPADTDPSPDPVIVGSMFLWPRPGQSLDLNVANTITAKEIEGATSYTFTGVQAGRQVLEVTVDRPSFLLPSQLIVGGGPWQMETGPMTLSVTANDDAGHLMARDEVSVVVEGGSSPPTMPSLDG